MPILGMFRILALVAPALSTGAASARTIEPITNFEDMPIRAPMPVSQVRETIIGAAAAIPSRAWTMTDSGPGKLLGRLTVRRHQALVEVTYSADRYSIVYLNSQRLNYRDGAINANYNAWVRELQKALEATLSSPAPASASSAAPAPAATLVPTAGGATTAAEISFWTSVRDSSDPKELQAYLDQFPSGLFAPIARARIAALGAKR